MKINEMKYIIVRKDSKIKRLKMENELMQDFLSSQKGSEAVDKVSSNL